jgi:hypothetical protein
VPARIELLRLPPDLCCEQWLAPGPVNAASDPTERRPWAERRRVQVGPSSPSSSLSRPDVRARFRRRAGGSLATCGVLSWASDRPGRSDLRRPFLGVGSAGTSRLDPIRSSATNLDDPRPNNLQHFRDAPSPSETPRAPSSIQRPEPQVTRPEPRVTASPKVCPGEHAHAPQTEHVRAPYTHRPLFVESAARAKAHEFQRLIVIADLRSHRSAKFVTTIEWRPVR